MKEYLDTQYRSEQYCELFRLPSSEVLHSERHCTVWDPYFKVSRSQQVDCNRADVALQLQVPGKLYLSENYMCFNSKEPGDCMLILPFREVLFLLSLLGSSC